MPRQLFWPFLLLFVIGKVSVCLATAKSDSTLYEALAVLPDSLRNDLSTHKTVELKITFLLNKATSFEQQNPILAEECALAAKELAEKNVLPIGRAKSFYRLASISIKQNYNSEVMESALANAQIAAKIFEENEMPKQLALTFDLLAAIYYYQYESDLAKIYNEKSIDIALSDQEMGGGTERKKLLAGFYNTKFSILSEQEKESAILWLRESYQLFDEIGDTARLAQANLNFTIVLPFDEREPYYLKAKTIYEQLSDVQGLRNTYIRYGSHCIEAFRKGQGEEWFTKGVGLLKRNYQVNGVQDCEVLDRLGWAYHIKWGVSAENSITRTIYRDSAAQYYEEALEQALEEGNVNCLKDIVASISMICQDTGDCPEALKKVSETYQGILESRKKLISASERKVKIYEFDKKELQVLKNNILMLLGFLALLSGIIVIYQRLRNKSLRREISANRAANRAQMNPHFISNTLGAIDSMVNFGKREEASYYLIQFSRLSRIILKQSRFSEVSLAQELEALEYLLSLEKLRLDDVLSYDVVVNTTLPPEEISIPPMLLQPFVENAIWHGIQTKQAPGHVKVEIKEHAKSYLFCVVEDDGIGREKAKEMQAQSVLKRTSFGMAITQERIEAIYGASKKIIDLKTPEGLAKGTRVEITLPIKKWKNGQDDKGRFG